MKRILLIIICLSALFKTEAQQNLGHHTDNYAGVYSLDFNPAEIVDSRFRFHMNIVSISNTVSNNYLSIKRNALFKDRETAFEDDDFTANYMKERLNGRDKGVYQNLDIKLPISMMFTFGKKKQQAIGLNIRTRTNINAGGIDERTARQSFNELELTDLQNVSILNKNFSIQAAVWNEVGLTYGREIINKDKHFVKAAGTFKITQGLGSAYFFSDNLDITFPSDTSLSVANSDFSFGYSEILSTIPGGAGDVFRNTKFGFGGDFGLVYEFRPKVDDYKYEMNGDPEWLDPRKNKYKLKVGLGVTDLGRIKFDNSRGEAREFFADRSDIWIDGAFGDAFEDFGDTGLEGFYDKLDSLFVLRQADGANYNMTLPTRINAYVDYNLWKGFYVNATASIAPGFVRNPEKTRSISEFSITPRFEHKWIGFYLPASINSHGNPHLGAGLRLGPLVVGTYDITPLFAKTNIYDANFYMSLSMPITRKLRDKDGDHVSNKKDKCKKEQGTWATLGCPDIDPCKENPATCTDSDGDGIVDAEDECPEEAGLAEFNGCPDTDSDGIQDSEDECPEVAGLAEFNGCPDTDGDGIPDHLDDCPMVAGPKENIGCPWLDTDGDGVPDKDDDCPNVAGPASNKGCPELKEEEKVIIKEAFDNLEFESGKSVIKKSSYPSLDKLAQVLKSNPNYKLRVDGHTDNTGNYASNMKLSIDRAESVKRYLMEHGIIGLRVITNGYGPDRPIGDNNTPAGRQQNRRVEMEIVFE